MDSNLRQRGKTVVDESYTLYVVECIWTDNSRGGDRQFGRYTPTAWNDKRDPNTTRTGFGEIFGNFEKMNPDVAQHPSRVVERMPYGGLGGDFKAIPAFTEPGPAFAYAARLAEFGENSAIYSDGGSAEDRLRNYSGPVRTRVVEDTASRTVIVVEQVEWPIGVAA